MSIPKVIVEISGGVCTAVHSNWPVSVEVLDHDDVKDLDRSKPEAKAVLDHAAALKAKISEMHPRL